MWIRDNESKHGTGIIYGREIVMCGRNKEETIMYGNASATFTYIHP